MYLAEKKAYWSLNIITLNLLYTIKFYISSYFFYFDAIYTSEVQYLLYISLLIHKSPSYDEAKTINRTV